MHDAGYKMHDAGYKMQDARYKMQDARCKMQDARCKMQDARCKMQDVGYLPAGSLPQFIRPSFGKERIIINSAKHIPPFHEIPHH